MKLLYFDDFKLGVLKGDTVVDVSPVVKDIPHIGPHDLISGLIERFADYRRKLEEATAKGSGVPVAQVRVRPPIPKPYNIDAMAVNYMEDGTRSEPAPTVRRLGPRRSGRTARHCPKFGWPCQDEAFRAHGTQVC